MSNLVASTVEIPGSLIQVMVTALGNGIYHWQARAVDGSGVASGWVSFGGNPESEADFQVSAAPAGGGGGGGGGCGSIGLDLLIPVFLIALIRRRRH